MTEVNEVTVGKKEEKRIVLSLVSNDDGICMSLFLNYYLYYIDGEAPIAASNRMNNGLLLLKNNNCVIQVMHIIWWSFSSHKMKRYLVAFSH